jgi:hypothetical protein
LISSWPHALGLPGFSGLIASWALPEILSGIQVRIFHQEGQCIKHCIQYKKVVQQSKDMRETWKSS